MPEGPEIKRAADQLTAAIAGRRVRQIFFAFDHLKPFEAQFTGQMVRAVEARGKALLIRFPDGWNIYTHNQLYGKWMIQAAGDVPKTNRQLRLAIHNHENSALLYSASEIQVLRDAELATHPFLQKLGPDVLNPKVTAATVRERFEDKRFRTQKLAALLLDQTFLAGPGNYLRSEILHVAGVHPGMRPADCSGVQLDRLARATIELARRSYRSGGITNDPARVAALKAAGWKRRDYRFFVFNRNGQPCFTCGTAIVKTTAGSRRLYFCPQCQKEERKGND